MLENKYPGKFVVFEGIDGSGKSTQIRRANDYLYDGDHVVSVMTKEPYVASPHGQPVHLGKEIYQVLKGEHDRTRLADLTLDQFQRYFYFPNRVQHYLDVIIPSLKQGLHVLSDRGAPSVCFGAENGGTLHQLMAEQLAMMNALRLPWPDAILIYDIPVEVALSRLQDAGKELDAHERGDILERVKENYRKFAKSWPNCYLIDGLGEPDEVWERETKPVLAEVFRRHGRPT